MSGVIVITTNQFYFYKEVNEVIPIKKNRPRRRSLSITSRYIEVWWTNTSIFFYEGALLDFIKSSDLK